MVTPNLRSLFEVILGVQGVRFRAAGFGDLNLKPHTLNLKP